MDVVLGLSMTAITVRVVLVEGERADGVTVENEAFDTVTPEGVPKPSPSEQVSNAILATQQNAVSIGHHLVVSGVAWEDEAQQAALRDSLIARGLDNVVLVSEQSAAGALAQTIGCALGYETTAVLLIKFDTATLSIVNSADGSIADGLTCNFGGAKLVDVLPGIVTSLETNDPHPQGVVIVGSCAEIGAVKSRLESLVAVPVIVPEEPDLGLARGAALAAANAVGLEAPTVCLAYSQDPDGGVKLSAADTLVVPPLEVELEDDLDSVVARIGRALLIPVGSFVAAICVLGLVTLVMSLAVSIGTTGANRGLPAAENVTAPSVVVPTPPPVQGPAVVRSPTSFPQAQVIQPPPLPASPEPVVIAPEPPVAAPVITPAPKPRAPTPVVQQPAPSRVITEPTPVAVATPLVAAPVAVEPPLVEAPPIAAPVAAPPPVALPPPVAAGPVPPPRQAPPLTFPWSPPTLQIGPLRIPLGPPQPAAPPPEQLPTGPPILPSAPQQAPQPPAWSPAQAPPPVLGGRDGGREGWWWWLWR
jgi:hypothetical protein